ncbi:hypothetical protein TCAL_00172 [Tigriopus californicus]|uniref:Polypeptide N-acetylgalactosaminyltransferase n=1 Tax=Tigriopus californicus TaxID=6832 RepID=A0A553P2H8_TIGCA|nr:N-acetylgalactosaminyltransferase 7-like [Tigriopus californicus]XP_059086897.1 N-acetylgalactosaminyltransferase 7-like [Tigriopus californicus]TRY71908.1 hypothetical protein TCAL_00172 [Tigriopus californicus]
MRVLQWRRGRIYKVGLASLTIVLILLGLLKHFGHPDMSASIGQNLRSPHAQEYGGWERQMGLGLGRRPHQSHPDELPVFLGEGHLGNFEPAGGLVKSTGPGEMGQSHRLTVDQKDEEEKLKGVYGFNQLVSDEISLNRTVPELREPECQFWDYPADLPKASVILVFHNEGWSTLLRTVHSVLNRSPPQFLTEVLLVDDKSELEHLGQPLEDQLLLPYYKNRVRLIRNTEREGLIRSRNNGAVAARGEVVVFLDAHCEVNVNWLPPLLAPIHADRRTLSVPIIDGIQWSDFSINPVYARNSHSRGIFEWGMLYKENTVPAKEENRRSHHSEPYRAPTHAGGLFAIDREWFKELGWYDPGLWVWGGENFELSFKVWMCGGSSVWVPCSRVAHVYRGHSCSSCHSGSLANKFGGQPTTLRNYKRVIETWFDPEYKEYFYTREPFARMVDMGDISEQLALKRNLKCKSFDWFMKEVAYDVFEKYPPLPPNKLWGELKNLANNFCLDTHGRHPPEKIAASGCHGFGGNQLFRYNTEGQITSGEWCADVDNSGSLTIQWCVAGDNSGPWEYRADEQQIYHTKKNVCLALEPESAKPITRPCDHNNAYHKWVWREITPYWAKNP